MEKWYITYIINDGVLLSNMILKQLCILELDIENSNSMLLTIDKLKPEVIILCEHKLNELEIIFFKIRVYKKGNYYERKLNKVSGVFLRVSD